MFTNLALFPSSLVPHINFHQITVLQRVLAEKNWRSREAASTVAKELFDVWIYCNVYPISEQRITDKIFKLTQKSLKG